MTIETSRLVLREIEENDWLVMAAYSLKPGARRYLLSGQGEEGYIRRWVTSTLVCAARDPRTFFGLAVCLKDGMRMVGICTLSAPIANTRVGHLGWELDRDHWGRGYATEAVGAMIAFAFETVGVQEVIADCFAANLASIRVMQKLGLRRQRGGLLYAWALAFHYHQKRPFVRHKMTAEEWKREEARRAEK